MAVATIGQYRVTGMIGHGGMGAVYAAEHVLLGRPAAIKVLLPELSQKQDIVTRFFNEARAATAIRHPGIVEIYDFGWTPEGAAYIVMEHLRGESLATRSSRGRFRWQDALAIARQIAGALSAAHATRIVHRDLKPDNIYVVPDPEVPAGERIKLLDFGIAKLAGESSSTVSVTRTGAVMGTPTYMAPEQCRGVALDHRADLYALGCIVFELCAGRPPFVGEGTGDLIAAHIHLPVPSLASVGVEVPPAVEQLIRRLLAKLPADRAQSADEVIRAIDGIATERAASAVWPSGARAVSLASQDTTLSGSASSHVHIPVAGRARGGRGRWIAGLAAAAAVASGVVVLAMGRGESAPAPSSSPGRSPTQAQATSPVETPHENVTAPAVPPGSRPDRTPPTPRMGATSLPAPAVASPAGSPAPSPSATHTTPPVAAATAPSPASRAAAPSPPPAPAALETVEATVDSVPSGAQVLVGGQLLGKTPFHGVLPRRTGDTTLVLRLAGYVDARVVVRADQPVRERVKLAPKAAPPPRRKRDDSVNPF